MKRPVELPQFDLGVRGAEALSRSACEAYFASREFRFFANHIADGLIVVDPDDIVILLNLTAERQARLAVPFESRSLVSFLRIADLDMEDLLAAAERGQTEGLVRGRSTGKSYHAIRKLLMTTGGAGGFQLYFLRDTDTQDRAKRGAVSRSISSSDQRESARLLFPDGLQTQIDQACRAYERNFRVLLLGESGVGKTAVAKHIHLSGGDRARPFIHVNCGSIPETLFESEMFGYERGAFTGALQAGKRGYIESAAGGTLFLDEVGEIPLSSQPKLLKFLEDGTIQPVGSAVSKKIETRVITATNRDLVQMTRDGAFRRDLLYRLSTFPVEMPLLRNRPDKEAILDMMLARASQERGQPLRLSASCRASILRHPFPGNLREMKSVVDYLDIVATGDARPEHLPPSFFATSPFPPSEPSPPLPEIDTEGRTLKELTRSFEEQIIQSALDRLGSKRAAAKQLGVDIATIVRKTNRPS